MTEHEPPAEPPAEPPSDDAPSDPPLDLSPFERPKMDRFQGTDETGSDIWTSEDL